MAGRVLSDASPLIGLGYVDGLPWLQQLFGAVWIPGEVKSGRKKSTKGLAAFSQQFADARPVIVTPDNFDLLSADPAKFLAML